MKDVSSICRELGISDAISQKYHSFGVQKLYDWQYECLSVPGVAENSKNLIYCAPTSGGKTLVAELLVFKAIFSGLKAIFVLPYVSLVEEKLRLFPS